MNCQLKLQQQHEGKSKGLDTLTSIDENSTAAGEEGHDETADEVLLRKTLFKNLHYCSKCSKCNFIFFVFLSFPVCKMQTTGSENTVENALRKRNYALKELIATEEKYIEDLALIVEG